MAKITIDSSLHQDQKPDWIKVRLPSNPRFFSLKALLEDLRLNTICESAQCPNRWECWSRGTATIMIAGDRCTRSCGFCAVSTAKPLPLEEDEPNRVAEAVRRMGLKYVVITAVARDDLPDGGSEHFVKTMHAIRSLNPSIMIEVLTPDFNGKKDSLKKVVDAYPDVLNHNIETVERLTPAVRSRAKYRVSLEFLKEAYLLSQSVHESMFTKSGIMLGLGETEAEILQTMDDLREADVSILTLGQYLRPSLNHLPVVEYITPEVFDMYRQIAENKGFEYVVSGPLVRSSYHADSVFPLNQ